MRLALLFAPVVLMPIALACAASGAGGDPPRTMAMVLSIAEPAFGEPKVMMAKSMPPQFTVVLEREMPTPGWSFTVDSIETDEQARRIVANLSEIGPEGITAQVITRTSCHIPLGSIDKGRYLLEIRLRRGSSGEHRLAQALVVDAR